MRERLIDANALMENQFEAECYGGWCGSVVSTEDVDKAPTIDPYHWIPSSERLPELPEDIYCRAEYNVLVDANNPFVTSMYYERTSVRGKPVERWTWHDRISPWEVEAWCQLPEPPKKDEL